MSNWLRKLRIGEKIGFGFGAVGLLFLGVIWQYHNTLQNALEDYRQLEDVYGVRKTQAMAVENNFLRAQREQKNFLLSRDENAAEAVLANLQRALEADETLRTVDPGTAIQIEDLIKNYEQRFRSVVAAWRSMGLDHNTGLQGAFRDSAHTMEDMATQLNVDRLYLLLLQIRRGEKDLGLRREQQYQQKVMQLIQLFSEELTASGLDENFKAGLLQEVAAYRETFNQYAITVLSDPQPVNGKGPFRDAAHRIEALLDARYLPDLGEKVLQLRRREKDYLLRHDNTYVDMAMAQLDEIEVQVASSNVTETYKTQFEELLRFYRRDFLALVEQNDSISELHDDMMAVVAEISSLIETNVGSAELAMADMRLSIDQSTTHSEKVMFWIVALATLLGILLTIAITYTIAHPLRKMSGLLDQVAAEEPAERMPFYPGGRDEVNAMAGSVNAIADHKTRFIAWWKASMREADAYASIEKLISEPHAIEFRHEAEDELRQAVKARKQLLWRQFDKLYQLSDQIVDSAKQLLQDYGQGTAQDELNRIRYSARSMQAILEMASAPEILQRDNARGKAAD
jgi:HAMP domain-containing protein